MKNPIPKGSKFEVQIKRKKYFYLNLKLLPGYLDATENASAIRILKLNSTSCKLFFNITFFLMDSYKSNINFCEFARTRMVGMYYYMPLTVTLVMPLSTSKRNRNNKKKTLT